MSDEVNKGEEGFTLLETLIAFAILATAMGFLFHSYSTSARALEVLEKRTLLVGLAETALERVDTEVPLKPGTYEGDFKLKGYSWVIDIEGPSLEEQSQLRRGDLYGVEVTVTVRSNGARPQQLSFQTRRLKVFAS